MPTVVVIIDKRLIIIRYHIKFRERESPEKRFRSHSTKETHHSSLVANYSIFFLPPQSSHFIDVTLLSQNVSCIFYSFQIIRETVILPGWTKYKTLWMKGGAAAAVACAVGVTCVRFCIIHGGRYGG